MNEINSIETIIIPEVPKVIDTEQLNVYIPIGTLNNPGLVKFNSNYFTVINGEVFIKLSPNAISDELGNNIIDTYQTKNDLVEKLKNYYLKSETYSQVEINNLIAGSGQSISANTENKPTDNLDNLTIGNKTYKVPNLISFEIQLEEVD